MSIYSFANPRYKSLAQELIDADPIILGHIDVDTIAFLSKEEKKPKWPLRIIALREPIIMLTNYLYYIEISEILMEGLSREHRELYMYKTLRQIDKDSGRIIHPDVIEFSDIIDLFGYDWQEKTNLPSIKDQLNARTVGTILVGDINENQQ